MLGSGSCKPCVEIEEPTRSDCRNIATQLKEPIKGRAAVCGSRHERGPTSHQRLTRLTSPYDDLDAHPATRASPDG
jgi:hypothetical protein